MSKVQDIVNVQLILATLILGTISTIALQGFLARSLVDHDTSIYLASIAVTVFECLILGLAVYQENQSISGIFGKFPSRKLFLYSLVLGCLFLLISIIQYAFVTAYFSRFQEIPQENVEINAKFLGVLLFTGVMRPIAEEFIFRGLLMPLWIKRYGVLIGVIATSAVFALLHLKLALIPKHFLFGVIAGFVVVRTSALWSAIILHITNNLGALLLDLAINGHFFNFVQRLSNSWIMMIITVLALLMMIFLTFYLLRNMPK